MTKSNLIVVIRMQGSPCSPICLVHAVSDARAASLETTWNGIHLFIVCCGFDLLIRGSGVAEKLRSCWQCTPGTSIAEQNWHIKPD